MVMRLKFRKICIKTKSKCAPCLTENPNSYLFVHEDIDDWVVDSCCLREKGRDGSQPGVKFYSRMSRHQYREGRIWCPGDHECQNHHHHHTGHLPLWLSGRSQTTMRYLDEPRPIKPLIYFFEWWLQTVV